MRTAATWFDTTGSDAAHIAAQNPGISMRQDEPAPDLAYDTRLSLTVDGLGVELIAAVGETIDSTIVWLPDHRVALISNLLGPLFPHFPNLNTLRGDRYRFIEPYLQSVRTLRSLQPEMLVTGRHEPIVGAELIDACLGRLYDAVDWVHRQTLAGINAGDDMWSLMRTVVLPEELRVGQGYGKVAWAVRTIWESYVGWFKLQSTTELYPMAHRQALAEIIEVAGADAAVERARRSLQQGDAVVAIHLAEGVLATDQMHAGAAAVMADSHRHLLTVGGAVNFWENEWLRTQLDHWEAS
jgi:alkyl sulfatase BDS1-like metallo-beta-lactamase superfamily hydrolase